MFRILIVEDIRRTIDELSALLGEAFHDSQIDKAETVNGAKAMIETAFSARRNYDAVILDFKLPLEKGENPEDDESICRLLRQRMPAALVAHITAHPSDDAVKKHMRSVHAEQVGYTAIDHSKLNVDWPSTLLRRLKEFLYGTRIEKQMNALFGFGATRAIAGRSRVRGNGGVTHELAALTYDIVRFWPELNDKTQKRVHEVFEVEVEGGSVKVGLL